MRQDHPPVLDPVISGGEIIAERKFEPMLGGVVGDGASHILLLTVAIARRSPCL